MKIKRIISSIILLGMSFVSLSGCNQCQCELIIRYTLRADIYNFDMSSKLDSVAYSDPPIVVSLSVNTTYILDVFIDDVDFNSNPEYLITYEDVLVDFNYSNESFDIHDYTAASSEHNHVYYSFNRELPTDNAATAHISTSHFTNYGVSYLFIDFVFK